MMVHSLVSVILPISLPPPYKPSFFANPNYSEDVDAQKETSPTDADTKWWYTLETTAHLFLYFLECTCVIAYAVIMYNYWTFDGEPYEMAFQEFWDDLGKEVRLDNLMLFWMKSPLFWTWLGLFCVGIFLVTLVLVLAFSDCKNHHPKKKKYKGTEGQGQEDNYPEEGSHILKCPEKRKKDIDFIAEREVWQIISREVNQEEVTSNKLFHAGNNQRKKMDEPRGLGKQLLDKPNNECHSYLPKDVNERDCISDGNNLPQGTIGQVFRLPNGELAQLTPLGSGIGIPGSTGVGKVDKGLGSAKKIEVHRPTSRENYVKAACANVPAESELIKNDLIGESANNEEIVNDVANAAAREEEGLQMQPKDRKLSAVNCKENHQVME